MPQTHPTCQLQLFDKRYIIVMVYLTTASNYRIADKSRTVKDVVRSGRGLSRHTSRDPIENDYDHSGFEPSLSRTEV
jgi:hypothetical protein